MQLPARILSQHQVVELCVTAHLGPMQVLQPSLGSPVTAQARHTGPLLLADHPPHLPESLRQSPHRPIEQSVVRDGSLPPVPRTPQPTHWYRVAPALPDLRAVKAGRRNCAQYSRQASSVADRTSSSGRF